MTLVGSKCYKLIHGSPDSGQENCTKDDPNSALMLPPTRVTAKYISMMLYVELDKYVGDQYISHVNYYNIQFGF